jgi:hypothetical protein
VRKWADFTDYLHKDRHWTKGRKGVEREGGRNGRKEKRSYLLARNCEVLPGGTDIWIYFKHSYTFPMYCY